MDQRTVESLLRRLVERVEESERRYGEALDELHTRLDHLSQTTEAARETSVPGDADTFDRLHAQVSNLARRLESETAAPLDDFERLGQALTGGLRGDNADRPSAPFFEPEPEPSPFAQAAMARPRSRLAPAADLPGKDIPMPPPSFIQPTTRDDSDSDFADLDKRLVDMAERLEHSIRSAMPTGAIEALNTRLDEIGGQIGQTLDGAPSHEAMERLESQISSMSQGLNRAEEQLGRINGVEQHLLKLIERLDEKDTATPTQIDPAQLQEIAAKAATDAARIVADDSKKTTERLDALQRDLTAMSGTSRESNNKLVSTLEAVHESLRQLVRQFERGSPSLGARARVPFAEHSHQAEAKPTAPFAQASAPQAPKQKAPPRGTTAGPRLPEVGSTQEAKRPDLGETSQAPAKDALRDRLSAAALDFKDTETPPPFGRAKRSSLDAEAVDLDAGMSKPDAPGDLVAAARRAAQAAAAQAEERSGRRTRIPLSGDASSTEQHGRRKRSLLIISAAALLVISAILLYGRLGSKPDATGVTSTPSAESIEIAPTDSTEGTPAPEADTPSHSVDPAVDPAQSGSWIPLPDTEFAPDAGFNPTNGAVGQATTGITDIAKSTGAGMPKGELNAEPQPASLKPMDESMLPPGVIFSIEEPASAADAATAERLTAAPVKAPMPPKAMGPLALRKAASEGHAGAQYAIAVRYLESKDTKRDPAKAAEWLERAARAGLAPAQYRLAAMYERGVGVDRNIDKSRSWYAAAAERGNVKAMHNLAVSVSGRDGIAPDYALAAKWYGEAAARGLTDSQFNLGILAEHGLGTTKNLREAYKWFALGSANGDPEAKKRREVIRVQLAPETLTAVEAEVKAWAAKPVSPEANEVPGAQAWAAKDPSEAAAVAPGTSLVTRAQTLLNKLGYDVGPPDGLLGERTRAGIRLFQQRNGLQETGEATIPLLSKLERLSS